MGRHMFFLTLSPCWVQADVAIPAMVEILVTAGNGPTRLRSRTLKADLEEVVNAMLFLTSYVTEAALPVDGGRSAMLVMAL